MYDPTLNRFAQNFSNPLLQEQLMMHLRALLVAGTALVAAAPALQAQGALSYQKPPQAILDVFDVENPPQPMVDPEARTLALVKRPAFLTLADLAQPELRLAGLRINPRTHNASRTRPFSGFTLQELATGKSIPVKGMPEKLSMEYATFSPTGQNFAFVEVRESGMALWLVDVATGNAKCVTAPTLSATMGRPYVWAADGKSLYVRVRPTTDAYPENQALPQGPAVQEALGVRAPARTFQDLLRNPADEAKFAFYTTTAIQRVDLEGKATPFLPPALYRAIQPSPNGAYVLVTEVQAPFSYQFPMDRFPYRVQVVDATGKAVATLAEKPLQDKIPVDFDACEAGRRHFAWREDQGAIVVWAEAQDGGDPTRAMDQHDAVYQLTAPFQGEGKLLAKLQNRFQGAVWGNDKLAILEDGWWKTRRTRAYRVDPSANTEPKVLFDRSSEDVYGDPGDFVTEPNAFHRKTLKLGAKGQQLFLQGEGCSPEGNRPFLDSFDLATGKTARLWRADGKATYEFIVQVLDPEKGKLLTLIQGPKLYPNVYLRTFGKRADLKAVTAIENPYKALDGVKKQIIKYKREDGVELSATLHLPPGYDPARDGKLPVLMEAYPTEFKDAKSAGQLRESPYTFSRPYWGTPIYWTLRGYAVLDNAQFPIVGQGKAEPNDTYIEQLVMNAKAAIQEVDRLGVGDPKRVACVGHSYGAFMVANLLAHSDLFAAGIARSGAYNRTLTPFGFQAEERTYWQVPEVYHRMSPFDYADKIKTPLLMIHGDADNNPGTFTLQSERLFQAVKGLGGKARLVLLPMESHSYAARENLLHMLWEQDTWLEKYVKGAKK
jgi:dipeptidyl aminopeptidase/acylaminoacyl peptidase